MKLATSNQTEFRVGCDASSPAAVRRLRAFTLAEVLAAMLFLAIVIPVAVEALHISSLAGEVAARKGAAARIADLVLNQSLVTTNWTGGSRNGTISESGLDFNWTLTAQNWPQGPNQALTSPGGQMISMEILSAEVKFLAQGRNYSVTLSTLANFPNQSGTANLSMR